MAGIYFLFYKDEVIYIGKSLNVKERMKGHFNKKFDSYSIINCNENELSELENKYIFKYYPKYNKIIGTGDIYFVGKLSEEVKNKTFTLNATILNNRLYIDLSEIDFSMYKKEPKVYTEEKLEEREERKRIEREKEALQFEEWDKTLRENCYKKQEELKTKGIIS